MSLEWIFIICFLGFLTLIGAIWNLVVIYSIAQMKIPVSDFLRKWSYMPWAISFICLGIVSYFVLQMFVVSVTSHDTVLFFDRERAARRVAKALGYPVAPRYENSVLISRMKEMAEEESS